MSSAEKRHGALPDFHRTDPADGRAALALRRQARPRPSARRHRVQARQHHFLFSDRDVADLERGVESGAVDTRKVTTAP